MSDQSRRNFLRNASISAAAVGVATVVPAVTSAADAKPLDTLDSGAVHEGSFTVWVKNAKAGEIAVMVGESEVVHQDHALAQRLARIAATATS